MIQNINRRSIIGASLFAVSGCATKNFANYNKKNLKELPNASEIDKAIQDALTKVKLVSGFSVSIYSQNGGFSKGYGVSDIRTGEKVTPDTVFYIASSTKSMVALALAIMHERGEIDLDMTLSQFAPAVKFPQEIKPNEVLLRNLLSQSSGISNSPIEYRLAFSGQYDENTLWELLPFSSANVTKPLGTFKYTNSNYNILTLLIEKKLGKNWKKILETEIFNKLGMSKTTAYISKAEKENWSIARPHLTLVSNGPKPSYLQKTDKTMHSAGGVFMSANDAQKWLEILVEEGRLGNKQIIPSAAINAVKTPHVPVNEVFANYTRKHYGLGFYIGEYGETKRQFIHHFGSFAGNRAHVSFMPEEKFGVAVFVNDSQIGFQLADIIADYIYNSLLGDKENTQKFENDINKLMTQVNAMQLKIANREKENKELKWQLSQSFANYSGIYENKQFGTFNIVFDAGALIVNLGIMHCIARPYSAPESIRVELVPGSGDIIKFISNPNGEIEGLSFAEYNFTKLNLK